LITNYVNQLSFKTAQQPPLPNTRLDYTQGFWRIVAFFEFGESGRQAYASPGVRAVPVFFIRIARTVITVSLV